MKQQNLILFTLCLCALAVNLDVSLVNVTLPRLAVDLHADTRQLQWIVDAYTLVFAALVLTAGSLSDRFGRRRALITGLVLYAAGNGAAALVTSSGGLIAARAFMGVGAAVIFPTTLSILTNVFTGRAERARAIGAWGAATGAAVALGPIAGGLLLRVSTWESTFLAKIPVALVAIGLVLWVVPDSRDPEAPRLDPGGFALSTAALGTLVYTIIDAPRTGWVSAQTLLLGALGLGLLVAFAAWERRVDHPMLEVRIFRNLRFSGASLSIAVAFFALSGFIFLIVQYFQFVRGWSPLGAGVRTLPVAVAIAVSSLVGTQLALRRSNKVVVTAGLALTGLGFGWVGLANGIHTSYLEIVAQMLLLGTGMGLTTAPATEAIMGTVTQGKAGIGSAINDTTRELGSTLGVAIVGSIYASAYASQATARLGGANLPPEAARAAHDSIGTAVATAQGLVRAGEASTADSLRALASDAFVHGMHAGMLVAAGSLFAGAVAVWALLPHRPAEQPADDGGGVLEAGRVPSVA